MNVARLSDEELLSNLSSICLQGHRLTARMLVYLGEVESRRLDVRAACTSMFDYCTRRLGMSEGEAYRRLTAARLVRKFPSLLASIERGDVHLSTLVLLAKHLTAVNVDAVVEEARGKTKLEVQELVARIAPRSDVLESIRQLPPARSPAAATGQVPTGQVPTGQVPTGQVAEAAGAAAEVNVAVLPTDGARDPEARYSLRNAAEERGNIEPLAQDRYLVQLTVNKAVKDKLERAKDLMRHRNIRGDGAVVLDEALDLLIAKLERERFKKTSRPVAVTRPTKKGYVPNPVRREVFARDGEQCTFVDDESRRCPARTLLELDHIQPRALGGSDDPLNLRVRCRVHNQLYAEQVFGKKHIESAIHFSQRKSTQQAEGELKTDSSQRSPRMSRSAHRRNVIDVASRGLVEMGFSRKEVHRAVKRVCARRANRPIPIELLVRETIDLLI